MAVKCNRCERYYRTSTAFYQHVRDSSHHHQCPMCDFDAESWDDLLDHCREQECYEVCQGCDGGVGKCWDSDEYWDHVEDYNVCTTCERHFSSPSSLRNHQITHRDAKFECIGCYRQFKTYGGMIIHLEMGACESGLDIIEINKIAANCFKWESFIDSDYRDEMLREQDLHAIYSNPRPYECLSCDVTFSKLSSLFQHVESGCCEQSLNDGAIRQLRNYLRARYS